MEIQVIMSLLDTVEADLLVVGLFESLTAAGYEAFDAPLRGLIEQVVGLGDFKGEAYKTTLLYTPGGTPAGRLLLVGLGKPDAFTADTARRAAGVAAQTMVKLQVRRVAVAVPGLGQENVAPGSLAQALVEGTLLGLYRFAGYRRSGAANGAQVEALQLVVPPGTPVEAFQRGVRVGEVMGEASNQARDLTNAVGNLLPPRELAARAQSLTEGTGIVCTVYGEETMREWGMGALLSVSQGSAEEAQFIVMEYFPASAATQETLVLLGKAITFDTGGISIKPADKMWLMKSDMGGGAAVIGAMRAIARLQLPVRVVGLVCAAENMPGSKAIKPGDVVRALNGKTIEYISTDAEGRMVLADGLAFAERYAPAAIIDCATLTGTMTRALGLELSGVFCNDDALYARLSAASTRAGEPIWRMPLWQPYRERIDSDVADMKNSGGLPGGAINAALFLNEFVPSGTPWAHFDIAATAFQETDRAFMTRGATAVPARLLVELVRDWSGETA